MSLTVIKCAPPQRPSRFERRYLNRPTTDNLSAGGHLGTFEGERKARCRGYDESYGAAQAMLSFIIIAFAVLGIVLMAYGVARGSL